MKQQRIGTSRRMRNELACRSASESHAVHRRETQHSLAHGGGARSISGQTSLRRFRLANDAKLSHASDQERSIHTEQTQNDWQNRA